MHKHPLKSDPTLCRTLGRVGAVALALLVWQALTYLPTLSILLASPLDVVIRLGSLVRESGFLGVVWFTFSRIVAGFGLGLVLGVVLGVLAGRLRWVETLLWPYMLTVKSVPVASFVVIVLIFFRLGVLSTVISFLMVLPIIYTGTLEGIRASDRDLDEMGAVFGVPFLRSLLYIRLPQILPHIRAACRVALGLCWKSGVAAELIGIPAGSVGEALYASKIYFDTTDLFCWTLLVVLISFAFEKCVLGLLGAAERVGRRVR